MKKKLEVEMAEVAKKYQDHHSIIEIIPSNAATFKKQPEISKTETEKESQGGAATEAAGTGVHQLDRMA